MAKNKKNPYKKAIANGAKELAKAVAGKVGGKRVKAKNASTRAANAVTKTSSAPTNTSFKFRTPVPTYTGIKNGIRIKHTEYVQDIQSANTAKVYSCSKWELNPANSDTFPWLSDQATSYAEYRFHSLSFHVGSLVSTSIDGMYGLCVTPDVTDSVPTNKTNFMQYENASRTNVWKPLVYHVPQDVLRRLPEYLTSIVDNSTDTTKQMGALFMCSQGVSGQAIDFGELYVSYDVELIHPQSPNADAVTVETVPTTSNFFTGAASQTGSTILATPRDATGAISTTSLQVQSAGDHLVVVSSSTASGLVNPSFSAADNFGNSVQIDSINNVVNSGQTAGINLFLVRNAPKPWYLITTSGAYTGTSAGRVYINRDWNGQTESLTGTLPKHVTDLEERLKRIELMVHCDSDDEHVVVASTPHPPSTPVPSVGYLKRRL